MFDSIPSFSHSVSCLVSASLFWWPPDTRSVVKVVGCPIVGNLYSLKPPYESNELCSFVALDLYPMQWSPGGIGEAVWVISVFLTNSRQLCFIGRFENHCCRQTHTHIYVYTYVYNYIFKEKLKIAALFETLSSCWWNFYYIKLM